MAETGLVVIPSETKSITIATPKITHHALRNLLNSGVSGIRRAYFAEEFVLRFAVEPFFPPDTSRLGFADDADFLVTPLGAPSFL